MTDDRAVKPHYPPHDGMWPERTHAAGWTGDGWTMDYESLNEGHLYASPLARYNAAIHALRTILISSNLFPPSDARYSSAGSFWTDHLIAAMQGRTGVILTYSRAVDSSYGYPARTLSKTIVLFPVAIRHQKRDGACCALDAYDSESGGWVIDFVLDAFTRAVPLIVPRDGRVRRGDDRLTDVYAARAYAALAGNQKRNDE